jgi:flagellar capping protein FliD|tara:strand:+ start:43 stop:183 length:141 start_codon:yes stop_codon:yes gene_type:complete
MGKEKETTEQRLKRFEKAYNILMDYFNDLPEETRIEVDERLNKENL